MIHTFVKAQPQKHWLTLLLGIVLLVAFVLPLGMVSAVGPNLALNRPAVASSIEGTGFEAVKAVDGNATSTRWASVEPATTAQWIYVDLGSTSTIGEVILKWEVAYGKSYQIQTSNDAVNWTSIYSTTTGDGATDDLIVSGSGRYVRVYMTLRGTSYGYSLWELEVYGAAGATATNTVTGPTATKTNTPVPPTATRTKTPVATATRTRTPTATSPATGDGSTWMGHNWAITNGGMAGVAPGSPSNVFVDANGYLHLKITKNGSAWTAAEMFSTDRMGFGTYQWQIEGNVTNMDKSTVLGLFPYGPADGIGGDGENEIDIEFSKWDNGCGTCTADFTFYPSTGNGNLGPSVEDNFHISQPSNFVTARIVWTSTSIVATIYDGLIPVGSTGTVLHTINYTPSSGAAQRIPQVALPLGMNFWSFQSFSASNQEVIIRNFQYVP